MQGTRAGNGGDKEPVKSDKSEMNRGKERGGGD